MLEISIRIWTRAERVSISIQQRANASCCIGLYTNEVSV